MATHATTAPHAVNSTQTTASWDGLSNAFGVKAHYRPDAEPGTPAATIDGFEGYTLEQIEAKARNMLSAVAWLRQREREEAEAALRQRLRRQEVEAIARMRGA